MSSRQQSSRQQAAVALGGNVGDVERTFGRALTRLERTQGLVVLRRSTWHTTAPIGGPEDQPDFLNGVVTIETTLAPEALLGALQEIEARLGRDRDGEVPNGPRPIDLDLLWHGDTVCDTDTLQLPHPRMEDRLFVLEPLAEILPDRLLPACGRTVRERVEELRAATSEGTSA